MKEDFSKSVDLNIMGMNLSISTDRDAAYIEKIQQFINENIGAAQVDNVSSLEACAYAFISVADKYFTLIEEQKKVYENLASRFSNVVNFIEDRIN